LSSTYTEGERSVNSEEDIAQTLVELLLQRE